MIYIYLLISCLVFQFENSLIFFFELQTNEIDGLYVKCSMHVTTDHFENFQSGTVRKSTYRPPIYTITAITASHVMWLTTLQPTQYILLCIADILFSITSWLSIDILLLFIIITIVLLLNAFIFNQWKTIWFANSRLCFSVFPLISADREFSINAIRYLYKTMQSIELHSFWCI